MGWEMSFGYQGQRLCRILGWKEGRGGKFPLILVIPSSVFPWHQKITQLIWIFFFFLKFFIRTIVFSPQLFEFPHKKPRKLIYWLLVSPVELLINFDKRTFIAPQKSSRFFFLPIFPSTLQINEKVGASDFFQFFQMDQKFGLIYLVRL